jgi:hypothetical protein
MVLTYEERATLRVRTWLTREHPQVIADKVGLITAAPTLHRPGGVDASDENAEWLANQLQAFTARHLATAPGVAGEFIRDGLSAVDWQDLAWDCLSWDVPAVTQETRS